MGGEGVGGGGGGAVGLQWGSGCRSPFPCNERSCGPPAGGWGEGRGASVSMHCRGQQEVFHGRGGQQEHCPTALRWPSPWAPHHQRCSGGRRLALGLGAHGLLAHRLRLVAHCGRLLAFKCLKRCAQAREGRTNKLQASGRAVRRRANWVSRQAALALSDSKYLPRLCTQRALDCPIQGACHTLCCSPPAVCRQALGGSLAHLHASI